MVRYARCIDHENLHMGCKFERPEGPTQSPTSSICISSSRLPRRRSIYVHGRLISYCGHRSTSCHPIDAAMSFFALEAFSLSPSVSSNHSSGCRYEYRQYSHPRRHPFNLGQSSSPRRWQSRYWTGDIRCQRSSQAARKDTLRKLRGPYAHQQRWAGQVWRHPCIQPKDASLFPSAFKQCTGPRDTDTRTAKSNHHQSWRFGQTNWHWSEYACEPRTSAQELFFVVEPCQTEDVRGSATARHHT